MVDLKLPRRAAILAAPPVAREHLAGEPAIGVGFKARSRPFRFEPVQGSPSPCRATAGKSQMLRGTRMKSVKRNPPRLRRSRDSTDSPALDERGD